MGEDFLEAGREAFARHAWQEAFDLLSTADAAETLSPEDLEKQAEAASWIERLDDCMRLRERSVAAYVQAGNARGAARVAIALTVAHFTRRNFAVGAGWFNKAQRLLADEAEGPEHGHLQNRAAHMLVAGGDLDGALAAAREAFEIGRRFADADLQAGTLSIQGAILIRQGQVEEGMALLDESMTSAVAGEIGPWMTAEIYCITISACHRLGDYRRAAEWTDAARGCAVRPGMAGFSGDCRAHRVAVMRMHGTWADALREAEKALVELESYDLNHVATAHYEVGELQLRTGDVAGAEASFVRADELGRRPQPGLALLRLGEGKVDEAAAAIAGALEDESWDRLARARLLPAAVQISVAKGDLDRAQAAVDELHDIAETYGSTAFKAASECAAGLLLLARGDAGAGKSLRRGARLWHEVEVPYEAACARAALAEALRADGDLEGSKLELRGALSTFERLGAQPDAERAGALLETMAVEAGADAPANKRRVRTFMFTDIVGSTNLVEAIGDEAWTGVLRWHDQALRSQFDAHHGEEIKHAGDGFFVAFSDATSAIECAVAIQRALAGHRREHGFSPAVRIGLHAAEATREGADYHGKGVHEAARIGALAEGGEILASEETVADAAAPCEISAPRSVTLKGIAGSTTIVTIAWQ